MYATVLIYWVSRKVNLPGGKNIENLFIEAVHESIECPTGHLWCISNGEIASGFAALFSSKIIRVLRNDILPTNKT